MSSNNPVTYGGDTRYFDTMAYTKLRKLCTADAADSRCEHFLRHGEMIDILPVAYGNSLSFSLGLPRVCKQKLQSSFQNAKQRYTGISWQNTVHLKKSQLLRAY